MQRVFGDLDALLYVDNRLDDERRAAFLAHLAETPQDAERVALWSRQNSAMRAAFAGVANEPVPLWLRMGHVAQERAAPREASGGSERRGRGAEVQMLDGRSASRRIEAAALASDAAVTTPRRSRRSTSVAISAFVLFAIAMLVLVGARALMPPPDGSAGRAVEATGTPVSRAVDAYQTYALDPVRSFEIPATQQAVLDKWLQRRLGFAVRAPDLRADGWTALGGRLVPGEAGPAAFYIYESAAGERLGLSVARSATSAPAALALEPMAGGGAVMSWTAGQTAYAVTVDRSLDWLSRNAESLRDRVARASLAD